MFFVVFEGLDGSGKSSLMKRLEAHLKNTGQDLIMTREPGGTTVGDEIREIILKKQAEPPSARTELLLYQASRAQHVDLVIRPALAQKKWVLCDRFSASSIAFQGGGRGISLDQVRWLNDFSTSLLKPHLTVLLDLSVEESKKRRSHRENTTAVAEDRIEAEADSFHEKVRQGFLDQAHADSENWLVLNAALTPEELYNQLIAKLTEKKWLR
ncbi:dTMP kinase [Pseudobdellovibrio sp. HCB154]|uniref:dTMP kinase n=1 Tax=Pseudobdellovibrio sp. HCB154 TaxID=3386277 RepID=UPI00391755D8